MSHHLVQLNRLTRAGNKHFCAIMTLLWYTHRFRKCCRIGIRIWANIKIASKANCWPTSNDFVLNVTEIEVIRHKNCNRIVYIYCVKIRRIRWSTDEYIHLNNSWNSAMTSDFDLKLKKVHRNSRQFRNLWFVSRLVHFRNVIDLDITTIVWVRRSITVIRECDLKTITSNFFLYWRKMASPRPKSPKTPVSKNEGESFWDKIGTIGRKKRIKEGK